MYIKTDRAKLKIRRRKLCRLMQQQVAYFCQQFPPNEYGLLKASRERPKTHPTMISRWASPFLSGLVLYHPDTAASYATSGGT